ncbi:MAG: large conductance mechanosensitive channel protein MscL [Ferruginibacter sp.]
MGFIKEFKEFAMKGNIMDLAIAVIIGGAFGKIITALVDDILMPVIGTFTGKGFNELSAKINGVDVMYGHFIQAAVDFLIVAFVLFLIIKGMNSMKKKQEEAPAGPSSTDALLMEIRDALKK